MKRMKTNFMTILVVSISLLTFCYSCTDDTNKENLLEKAEEKLDFKTVKIGNQEWMAENLKVSNFRNGDPITLMSSYKSWYQITVEHKPGWCYYLDDYHYDKKYGKLYNYYAVIDPRGLAPNGWHIPSAAEWRQLISYLGENAARKIKSTYDWANRISYYNGTNESGFSALPGGRCEGQRIYQYDRKSAYFWSSTDTIMYGSPKGWTLSLEYDDDSVYTHYLGQTNCFSVRCIKD